MHALDIVPALHSEHWKRLIETIWNTGARPRIPVSRESLEDVENIQRWMHEKSMLALSFRSPSGEAEIDLFISQSENLPGLLERAIHLEFKGHTYHIANIDDLIEMKRVAGRPQDHLDIEFLKALKEKRQD